MIVRRLQAVALEEGEQVFVPHQEVAGHQHKLKIHLLLRLPGGHGMQEALHGQPLQQHRHSAAEHEHKTQHCSQQMAQHAVTAHRGSWPPVMLSSA